MGGVVFLSRPDHDRLDLLVAGTRMSHSFCPLPLPLPMPIGVLPRRVVPGATRRSLVKT